MCCIHVNKYVRTLEFLIIIMGFVCIEFKIPISSGQKKDKIRNLKFYAHKSSSLTCIGTLSSTVNYHPHQLLLVYAVFSQSHLNPYSTCLNFNFFSSP